MTDWSPVAEVLDLGVRERVFPGAVIEVGCRSARRWRAAYGCLSYAPDAEPTSTDTVYDLASLTKVLATMPVAMCLVESGRLNLRATIAEWLPAWAGDDRAHVTPHDLLAHASGLPAWLPLHTTCRSGPAFVSAISRVPLAYPPRSASLYSDLGFIMLGAVLEACATVSLDRAAAQVWRAMGDEVETGVFFGPVRAPRGGVAPTRERDERGPIPPGEVDDTNAWALGGVAAHAGLFGTVAGVGAFARAYLAALTGTRVPGAFGPDTATAFVQPAGIPGSSRALGWDLMRPTSSCGARWSAQAFGHTGFTGTSLWIDPVADVYVVLLTNRVHPVAGDNDGIQMVRRAVHDAVAGVVHG